jgi:uncharacterized tellurite resistance protein B-like protein
MENIVLNKLLLRTAFSCMACDGDIDSKEVDLIKKLHQETNFFGEIDINSEMENLILEINKDGRNFFEKYFNDLTSSNLNEEDELKLIEVAIETILADENIEYSEIKFFKVIRSKLKIENKLILDKHPNFEEYLEQDIISESYLSKLQNEYFDVQEISKFDITKSFSLDFLDIEDKIE